MFSNKAPFQISTCVPILCSFLFRKDSVQGSYVILVSHKYFKTIPLIMIFFLASLIFQDTEVFRHKNRFFVFFPQKNPVFPVSECSFVIKCELNIPEQEDDIQKPSQGHVTHDVSFISILLGSMFDHLLKAVSPLNALSIIPGGEGPWKLLRLFTVGSNPSIKYIMSFAFSLN